MVIARGPGRFAFGSLAMALLPAAAPATAPSARAEGEAPFSMELWNGLMSPYCPGRSLMD